jgi:hypothetical protein
VPAQRIYDLPSKTFYMEYPKEFVEWAIRNVRIDEDGYNVWVSWFDDDPSTWDTLDEVYEYWQKNEKRSSDTALR